MGWPPVLPSHWPRDAAAAIALQRALAGTVVRTGTPGEVRTVAGVDCALGSVGTRGRAAAVVCDYPGLMPRAVGVIEDTVPFPYVPGLLSFRETPLVLGALGRVGGPPDLLLVDGHGYSHPRRFGIACHLGVLLDVPTIGVAKSRLTGEPAEVGSAPGDVAYLRDGDEVIGAIVRTRAGVKPVYVSVGHRLSLEAAVEWTLRCGAGYRLPEPTRLADVAAGGGDPWRHAARLSSG